MGPPPSLQRSVRRRPLLRESENSLSQQKRSAAAGCRVADGRRCPDRCASGRPRWPAGSGGCTSRNASPGARGAAAANRRAIPCPRWIASAPSCRRIIHQVCGRWARTRPIYRRRGYLDVYLHLHGVCPAVQDSRRQSGGCEYSSGMGPERRRAGPALQDIAPPPPPADTPPPTIAIGQTMNQVTAGFGTTAEGRQPGRESCLLLQGHEGNLRQRKSQQCGVERVQSNLRSANASTKERIER